MKKFLITQLTQVSSWIGISLIICAFIAPRYMIVILGLLLILTDDEALKGWVSRNAPWISDRINKWIN